MNEIAEDILMHYGMPRRSGRYPWGSGKEPYQHSGDFLSRVESLKSEGKSEKDIAEEIGLTTTQLRTQVSLAKTERRALQVKTAEGLATKGYSPTEIGRQMGDIPESTVRSLLNKEAKVRTNQAQVAADKIRKRVDEVGIVQVGAGTETELGVSTEKLNQALYILQREGYELYGGRVPQVTNPGKQTTIKAICPPGTEHKDIYDYSKLHSYTEYKSTDNGETFRKAFEYPSSLDSKRLQIRYNEEGGVDKDGVIELRRGVKDLSMGNSAYSQVRIMVDGTHYLKGMAVYSDDLPDGVDVRFNTNKHVGTSKMDCLKKIKDDPNNPFGSLIKESGGQSYYDDPNGKYTDPNTGKKQSLSLINKRAEEGDWGEWSKKVSHQFLEKQNKDLIKKQLELTKADKDDEFDEICKLTNPTVKRKLLEDFADGCDSDAVHLKAASLPRQSYQVILPLTTIKDNEVYAPNYKDGETVALIRYPHAGTFEIPILKVNNKNAEGKSVMGTNPADAIGINKKNADRLSGADFDGDTVMVIPCNSRYSKVKITSTPALKGLADFDTKESYGPDSSEPVKVDYIKNDKGKVIKEVKYYSRNGKIFKEMGNKQQQMGSVSNLITDMTIKGATTDELARAVRHSMVVIDAEKHHLDYRQSAIDNDISALKKKYQGVENPETGKISTATSTLMSRAKSPTEVTKKKGSGIIDPETGEKIFREANEHYYDNKTGTWKTRMQKSTKMADTKDARYLSSGTVQEELYADYANHMKALGNKARLEILKTPRLAYDKTAKERYSEEVKSLESKLKISKLNAPKERQAQVIANAEVRYLQEQNPDMTKKEKKKISQQALSRAREKVGAKRNPIDISDSEWEAIQKGAISDSKLTQILRYADTDQIKERCTPRQKTMLSNAKISRIKALSNSGYTNAEIAELFGVSTSTVSGYLKEKAS